MYPVDWGLLVVFYLFLAGAGAAAYYTGVLAETLNPEKFRHFGRYGSYIALPFLGLGVIMLTLDLGRPYLFFRLLLHFRPYSTMSIGAWLLLFFGIVMTYYTLMQMARDERLCSRWPWLKAFRGSEGWLKAVGLVGVPLALLVAAYTGVLLANATTGLWSTTPFLGALFVMSATSTGIACLVLVVDWRGEGRQGMKELARSEVLVLIFEAITLGIFLVGLGYTAPEVLKALLTGPYSAAFWLGVVGCGLVLPLTIELRHSAAVAAGKISRAPALAAVLTLIGGFLLRYVILFAGQSV